MEAQVKPNCFLIPSYLLVGLATFALILVFVIALPLEAKAQEGSVMNFSVGNAVPTVGAVTCTHPTLSEATNYWLVCNASLTDLNGYQDIWNCSGVFFKTTSGQAGTADGNVRYLNGTCARSSGSGNIIDCNCGFFMKYYADGGVGWTGNITARDTASADFTAGTLSVSQLLAVQLNINTVRWGTLSVSTNTSFGGGNLTVLNNTGNFNLSIQVQAGAATMLCVPSPTQPACANVKSSTTTGSFDATGTALTVSYANVGADAWADNRRDTTNGLENKTVYWAVNVPTGTNGTCTITVNQYGIAGTDS